MDTKVKRLLELLESLETPKSQLEYIANDFEEAGIEYCVIGGLSLSIYNYLRNTEDVDILVSKDTHHLIADSLVGHGYTIRPGSKKNLYYISATKKIKVDILVEGDKEGTILMPSPVDIRTKVSGIWYIDLPNLIAFKIRAGRPGIDDQDVSRLILNNRLNIQFADKLPNDVKDKYKEIHKNLNEK